MNTEKIRFKQISRGQEAYEFIGYLAIALHGQGIRIRLSTLQRILNDKGADYERGIGMGKVVSTAYEYWKNKEDWVTHHAIAFAFTGQNDEYLFT